MANKPCKRRGHCISVYVPGICDFIAEAHMNWGVGKVELVVCLLPSRTDTRWFHKHIWDRESNKTYDEVEFRLLPGRLTFKGAPHAAPFPSCVVIFR